MSERIDHFAMGWRPDLPDFRDFTAESETIPTRARRAGAATSVRKMLDQIGVTRAERLPAKVDSLIAYCSPVEDQKALGSCTANAAVGLLEYFERRAFGRHLDASRLFVYKATRNLLGWKGDTGAYLRSTMGAIALFGAPPENAWPYDITRSEDEPPAFCYAFAQNFQALNYFRLDGPGTTASELLKKIKTQLAAGIPSMFGFTVYDSITQARMSGKIPFPVSAERVAGGHAVMAMGYDDAMVIKNIGPGARETVGAVQIRNSWGTSWGQQGYGWLPYEYVLQGLAIDWWCLLKNEWIDTKAFGA